MSEWTDVPGFEGRYLMTKAGRFKRASRCVMVGNGAWKELPEQELKPYIGFDGRTKVDFWKDGVRFTEYVHRLIALCHVPNPQQKPYVKFLDNNPLNLAASNLKWTGCPAGF